MKTVFYYFLSNLQNSVRGKTQYILKTCLFHQWRSQPQKSPRAATVASRGQALLRRAAGRCRTGAWRSGRRWHPAAQQLRDWALGHLGTGSRRDSGGRRWAGCVPHEGGLGRPPPVGMAPQAAARRPVGDILSSRWNPGEADLGRPP